jgi:hypothetical protein
MNNLQLKILERLCDHIECGVQVSSHVNIGISFSYPPDLNRRECEFSGPGNLLLKICLDNIFTE